MPKRPGRKSAAQTPAPRSERIYGSKKNKPGSASGQTEAKITLSDEVVKALQKKADEFNEKHPSKRVTIGTLKKVFRRGSGAYSKSHRPTITGNRPNSRTAWSYARVNKFLKKKAGQKVKAAYVQDDDLLMEGGEIMAKGGLLGNYAFTDKGMGRIATASKKLQNTDENENANQLEVKIFNLIGDWIEGSEKPEANSLYKNRKTLDDLKKQYPSIFQAPKNKLVYRGLEFPSDALIEEFFNDLDFSEIIPVKGYFKDNDFYFIKKPVKYIPRQNAESWTTELKTAMRFGEYGVVLVTKTSDNFYMNPEVLDAFSSEILGAKEHEVILIGKEVENVHLMMSQAALQRFVAKLADLKPRRFKGLEEFFEKGGKVKFNDKELLSKYKRGESIGFTAVAHLKAKGLIPRADGTKRKSDKYLEDGGTIKDYLKNVIKKTTSEGEKYYADFGRDGKIVWSDWTSDANTIYIDRIDRHANQEWVGKYRYSETSEGKKDAKGEGSYAIASLFMRYPDIEFITYNDASENQDGTSFWYRIGGDSSYLFKENFFDYFNSKYSQSYAEGGLIAPNGKPSNLTPEQYKLVRTPEFKAWFGDWENDPQSASKVVDDNGEPLVVYHGTEMIFSIFDKNSIGSASGEPNEGNGFYFTSDYLNAKSYADYYSKTSGGEFPSIVLACFLKANNPLIKSSVSRSSDILDDVNYASKNGYDAFIVSKVRESGEYSSVEGANQIVVFEPEQIKIADGSNTTFDSSNPDIRYDEGGVTITDDEYIFFVGGEEYIGKSIKENDIVVGGIAYDKEDEEIQGITIKNKYRNRGLAKKAIKEVFENDKNLKSVYVRAVPKAKKFWEKIGTDFENYNEDAGLWEGTLKRYNEGGVVFVRNKNYDNSETIRRLPYRGVSAFAVHTDDFERFKQYAEKEEGVDPSNWQVYNLDDFQDYEVCAMEMDDTNDYVMGFTDEKPTLKPFNPGEHTMLIDENGQLDYDDAHEVIILPKKMVDGGMTALFIDSLMTSAKEVDAIIDYSIENEINPNQMTLDEFNDKVNPDGKYSKFEVRLAKRDLSKYFKDGGNIKETNMKMTCKKCGWEWNTADSDKSDASICHKCGTNNVSEDIIQMNSPTYLRSLEFAREDAKEDVDLHKVTENAVALSKEKPIRMSEYEDLVKLAAGGKTMTDVEWQEYITPIIENLNNLLQSGGISFENYQSAIANLKMPKADDRGDYADGGQLFKYEPKEYEIQEFVCMEQDLADSLLGSDMTKVGKIRICQAKIDLAENKLKETESEQAYEAWYMSSCIWRDCMKDLRSSNFKSGGRVSGCGCKEYKDGGLAYGNSHAKGGMPMTVKNTGQNIEIEGGEGVVNKRSMQMSKQVEFQGKKMTPCEVISSINEMGGGVKFKCNDVKKIIDRDGEYD